MLTFSATVNVACGMYTLWTPWKRGIELVVWGDIWKVSKWTVISDNDRERNMMLTVGGVSSSSPGLRTEGICVGIADTIAETDRRFGEGSVSTSGASGWSTPTRIAVSRLSAGGRLLKSMKKHEISMLSQGFSYYLVSVYSVTTLWWWSELEPGSTNDDTDSDDRERRGREDIFPLEDWERLFVGLFFDPSGVSIG